MNIEELTKLLKTNQKIIDNLVDNNLELLKLLEPEEPEKIGDVKAMRLSMKMTVNEFSKYLGIAPITYYKWEQSPSRQHAAVTRLINVMQLIKVMSPSLHEQIVIDAKNR